MTAQDLSTLRRVTAPAFSPNDRCLDHQFRETDLAVNKGTTDRWLLDLSRKGAASVKVVMALAGNEHDPAGQICIVL